MSSNVSNDFLWALTSNNSSKVVKRRSAGGVSFSTDCLNASGKNTRSVSSLVNDTAIGVSLDKKGNYIIAKKVGSFSKPKSAVKITKLQKAAGSRAVIAAVVAASKGYNDKLTYPLVVKASALARSKTTKKVYPNKR